MALSSRGLSTLLVLGSVIVAIVGYVVGVEAKVVAGSVQTAAALAPAQRAILTADVVLQPPSGWQPSIGTPTIPGLALEHALTFAPSGQAGQAGLLTGLVPGGGAAPLPASFVASMRSLPASEVVVLPQTEAFHYSALQIAGYDRQLVVYAVPSLGGDTTILACYASAAMTALLASCEQAITTMRPVGQGNGGNLAPDPAYGRKVTATVAVLDRARQAARAHMSHGAALAQIARLAPPLARSFALAAAKLGALEPPAPAGQAQATLARSLLAAGDAYTALGAAAGAGPSSYDNARARVQRAETSVGAALGSFALLGYRQP